MVEMATQPAASPVEEQSRACLEMERELAATIQLHKAYQHHMVDQVHLSLHHACGSLHEDQYVDPFLLMVTNEQVVNDGETSCAMTIAGRDACNIQMFHTVMPDPTKIEKMARSIGLKVADDSSHNGNTVTGTR